MAREELGMLALGTSTLSQQCVTHDLGTNGTCGDSWEGPTISQHRQLFLFFVFVLYPLSFPSVFLSFFIIMLFTFILFPISPFYLLLIIKLWIICNNTHKHFLALLKMKYAEKMSQLDYTLSMILSKNLNIKNSFLEIPPWPKYPR